MKLPWRGQFIFAKLRAVLSVSNGNVEYIFFFCNKIYPGEEYLNPNNVDS